MYYLSANSDEVLNFDIFYDKNKNGRLELFIGTKSELHAMNYYRNHMATACNSLSKKWDKDILKQDYIYNLSKAINSNSNLPSKILKSFVPRDHQKVAIEFGNLTNGCFIIADQQRTGKTHSSLLYILSQEWDKCLIICPSKVCLVWQKMIHNICGEESKILKSNDIIENGFNIISYDILHTINNRDCDIAVTDECHFFVNGTARRSEAVYGVRAEKRIALSGTPILNSIFEMISILKWVNIDLANELNNFIDINERIGVTPYNLAKLVGKELRRSCLLLRETSQVGETKEPIINFIEIDNSVTDVKNIKEVGKAMVNYAIEYLNSFENKIVVMFYHHEVGSMLSARLGNKAIKVDGTNNKKDIIDAIEEFKNNPNKQFLCGSEVLAEGIDLSFCSQMLILQSSYSMKTDQVRERCNNIYKNEDVIIDILTIPNTQSERQYKIIDNKYSLQYGMRDS